MIDKLNQKDLDIVLHVVNYMECYIGNHGVKYIKVRPIQKIRGMKKDYYISR